tara:strand:- start:713 stop:1000 length:288 start_codon:yes stop_codon:yes gene_type:complete
MAKKPTIKELNETQKILTSQLNFTMRMLDSVGVAFSSFVKFMEKEEDFKKYLEKQKNLHKLSKEEQDARKKGHLDKNDGTSTEEIREEKDAPVQS